MAEAKSIGAEAERAEGGHPNAGLTRIMRLDSLELTYRASTKDSAGLRRRFMTLSVPTGSGSSLRGGVGYVVKAESVGAQGELFALKRLKVPVGGAAASENPQAAQLAASFRQEYDVHRVLSPTGLVPELHGWARIAGEPAILMEWVEGITLRDAAEQLRGPDGRVPLEVVAGIGLSVLAALRRIELVDEGLVHRDLSPGNIMIRTGRRSLEDQVQAGIYDICLIDFGSATMEQDAGGSFTMAENFWRGATPGYAPPEMLDRESGEAAGMRHSHAIDIYALCSVLYELYSGHVPYDTARRAEHAIYEMKTTEPPRQAELRADDDGSLREAIVGGLAARQEDRPTAEALAGELQSWEEARGTSRPWAQTFASLVEADATAAAKTSPSLSPTVLEMPSAGPAGAENALGRRPAEKPAFRTRHPRLVAWVAVAVAVVAVLAVAGGLTNWFGFGPVQPRDSVNDYSWSELSRISRQVSDAADGNEAQRIEAEYHLVNSDGDLDGTQTKDVVLSDGTQVRVVITGFCHDERSDGSGKAGISFAFTGPVGKQPIDTEEEKTRSWSRTSLRAWLAGDFSANLPDDLGQEVVEVKKESLVLSPYSEDGGGELQGITEGGRSLRWSATTESTDDRIWLYSEAEVRGGADNEIARSLGWSDTQANALQYELFSNSTVNADYSGQGPSGTVQSQLASSTSMFGSGSGSWVRTPGRDTDRGFKTIDRDGDDEDVVSSKRVGVVPGFCV